MFLMELQAGSYGLYKAFEISRRFNILMYELLSDKMQAIEFAKQHYEEIAKIREES